MTKGVHHIDLGPWPPALVLIADRAAYGRFMRSQCGKHPFQPFPKPRGGLCTELKNEAGDLLLVIAIGAQPDSIELAASLAHEATHAMRWILEYVSEREPGAETQAYLVEHIVKQGLKALANG